MREIRTLRAMRRALETKSRNFLNGHEGGNAGYSQGGSCGFTRQRSTLPGTPRCPLRGDRRHRGSQDDHGREGLHSLIPPVCNLLIQSRQPRLCTFVRDRQKPLYAFGADNVRVRVTGFAFCKRGHLGF